MGNRITAARWARILKQLGHHVQIGTRYEGQSADLLIGLHARKSASSIRSFCERYPKRPCFVALTGTDLYGDLQRSTIAQDSLKLASRFLKVISGAYRKNSKQLGKHWPYSGQGSLRDSQIFDIEMISDTY